MSKYITIRNGENYVTISSEIIDFQDEHDVPIFKVSNQDRNKIRADIFMVTMFCRLSDLTEPLPPEWGYPLV